MGHLMRQAGINPLPLQTAAHMVQPGAMSHDGLWFNDAPLAEGKTTLQRISRMIGDIQANANGDENTTPRDATT